MNDVDFVNEVVGSAWVNRAEGENGCYDCYGVVIAGFKRVYGIELPPLGGYKDKNCSTESAAKEATDTGLFTPSQPTDGAIMTVEDDHGNITHVGLCICGRVLHATESLGAKWDKYTSINSQFKNIGYYRYAAN